MKKILIVDDNKDLLSELKEAFEGAGYKVAAAADGKSALELTVKVSPDLLLLDLNLPDISGFEVAHTLKTGKETRTIPIITMTGHYSEEERKYAINICGIRKCLTKPLEIKELFKEIDELLEEG